MRVYETDNSEVLQILDNSILMRLSGCALIVVAVAIWPMVLSADLEPDESHSDLGTLFVLGCSVSMALFGLLLLFLHSHIAINRHLRKVSQLYRIASWKRTFEYEFTDFNAVQIVKSTGRILDWKVELVGNRESLSIGSGMSHAETVELAHRIATFTGLPLESHQD